MQVPETHEDPDEQEAPDPLNRRRRLFEEPLEDAALHLELASAGAPT
jgi:hypothetical protein